jgi:hypothetical protein
LLIKLKQQKYSQNLPIPWLFQKHNPIIFISFRL